MEENRLFTIVRAVGALASIITLNALVIIAYLDSGTPVPRWSIYVLIVMIGGLLGLDALTSVAPGKFNGDD